MSILAYIIHGSSQSFMELVKGSKGKLPLPFLPKTYTSRLSGTKEACPVFLWELSGEDALQLVADALTRLFHRLTMSKFGSYRSILALHGGIRKPLFTPYPAPHTMSNSHAARSNYGPFSEADLKFARKTNAPIFVGRRDGNVHRADPNGDITIITRK